MEVDGVLGAKGVGGDALGPHEHLHRQEVEGGDLDHRLDRRRPDELQVADDERERDEVREDERRRRDALAHRRRVARHEPHVEADQPGAEQPHDQHDQQRHDPVVRAAVGAARRVVEVDLEVAAERDARVRRQAVAAAGAGAAAATEQRDRPRLVVVEGVAAELERGAAALQRLRVAHVGQVAGERVVGDVEQLEVRQPRHQQRRQLVPQPVARQLERDDDAAARLRAVVEPRALRLRARRLRVAIAGGAASACVGRVVDALGGGGGGGGAATTATRR